MLLQQIAKRWPDFAPAYYALAEETGREAPAEAVAAYRHYAELMPLDPRPWTALGSLLNEQQRFGEAESAFREAVRRDQTNHRPHVQLANFYLEQNQPEKARLSLAAAFKVSAKANEIFNAFGSDEDDDLSPEMLARTEALLQSFPQELAKSQDGLRVLARMQQAQQKYEAAIATMQRVTALKAESTDYLMLAEIHLAARQFAKALGAADQSLKLEAENPQAHYQRACALAQLNRKAEALAALKQALALQPAYAHMLSGEADLQPVAGTPEFKALLPKAEESQPKEDPAPPKPKQV